MRLDCFLRDERGGTLILAAFLFPVVLGVAAIAIDYGRAHSVKARVQAASDIAALAGAQVLLEGQQEAKTAAESVLVTYKEEWTNFNATTSVDTTADEVSVTASIDLSTMFAKVFGVDTLPVKVISKGGAVFPPVDVHIAVDVSASMQIASTAADRQLLKDITKPMMRLGFASQSPDGCTFACHQETIAVETSPPGMTLYQVAKANNISIREDVVHARTTELVQSLLGANDTRDVRVSLYAHGEWGERLVKVTSLPFDAADRLKDADVLNRQRTKYRVSLPWIASDASSQSGNRGKIMVLITDGAYDPIEGFVATNIDADICDAIKAQGFELYVIEIKYENLAGHELFDTYVGPNWTKITPGLQACASPGRFFSASNPASIATAMDNVRKSVQNTVVKLTR